MKLSGRYMPGMRVWSEFNGALREAVVMSVGRKYLLVVEFGTRRKVKLDPARIQPKAAR